MPLVVNQAMRDSGVHAGRPSSFSQQDRQAFGQQLDRQLAAFTSLKR
jgi:uncharacterized protein YaiI (UPF0178 family)